MIPHQLWIAWGIFGAVVFGFTALMAFQTCLETPDPKEGVVSAIVSLICAFIAITLVVLVDANF